MRNDLSAACPETFEHQCFNSIPYRSRKRAKCAMMLRQHGRSICGVKEVRESCALSCRMCSREESVLRSNQVKVVHAKEEDGEEGDIEAGDEEEESRFTGIGNCPNPRVVELDEEEHGIKKLVYCDPVRVDPY